MLLVIQTQGTDCNLTGLPLPSHLSLSRSSLQFFWSLFFFFLFKWHDAPSIYPTGRGALWSIFLLISQGDIYRRLLLGFFLGFRLLFHKVFQDLPPTIIYICKDKINTCNGQLCNKWKSKQSSHESDSFLGETNLALSGHLLRTFASVFFLGAYKHLTRYSSNTFQFW